MKEIQGIKLENYRVPSVREFMCSFYDEAVKNCETVMTGMPTVYPAWKMAFDEMLRVYEISLKSPQTAKARNIDDRRDNVHTAIMAAANSARKAMDDETREKGIAVWDTMNSFPVNINAQYNIETAQIDSLLGVLLGAQRQNVEDLGLLPLVNSLKALNDQFHELIGLRDLENNDKPEGQRQEAMNKVIHAYKQLIKFVNAYYLIYIETEGRQNPQLSLFMDTTNTLITRYRKTYKKTISTDEDDTNGGEDGEDTEDGDGTGGGTGGGAGNNPSDPNNPNNPSNPNNPNNPNNPGSGSGSGNDNQEPTLVTMLYLYHDNTEDTRRGEPGTRLVSPEPDAGYEWQPTPPNVFPDTDRTFTEVEIEDNGEGDGDDDAGFGR